VRVFRITWSFRNHHKDADLVLNKLLLLSMMLKTVVFLNIFVGKQIFSGFSDEQKVQNNSIFLKYKSFVTLCMSLLPQLINLMHPYRLKYYFLLKKKNLTVPKLLSGSVYFLNFNVQSWEGKQPTTNFNNP